MARIADPNLRPRILQAAREAFKEKGYVAARMSDIAERAGVAVGSIYLHFKTKEDLCAALGDEVNRRMLDESLPLLLEPDAARGVEKSVRAAMRIMAEERDLLSLLYLSIGFGPLESRQLSETDIQVWQTLARNLQSRMDDGAFRRYDPDKLAQLVSSLIERAAAGCLVMGAGEIGDYTGIMIEFLQNALLVNPPHTVARARKGARTHRRKTQDKHQED